MTLPGTAASGRDLGQVLPAGHHSSRSGRRWRRLDDIPAGSVQNARAHLTFSLRTKDADVLVLSAGFDALLPWLLVALALAIAFALWRLRLRAMQRADVFTPSSMSTGSS